MQNFNAIFSETKYFGNKVLFLDFSETKYYSETKYFGNKYFINRKQSISETSTFSRFFRKQSISETKYFFSYLLQPYAIPCNLNMYLLDQSAFINFEKNILEFYNGKYFSKFQCKFLGKTNLLFLIFF